MAIFYVNPTIAVEGDGTSWANAKGKISNVTAAIVGPGDEIRVAKSPIPTAVGTVSATWVNNSSIVTLNVNNMTTEIDSCHYTWVSASTAGAGNVTVTLTSAAGTWKEGGRGASISIAAGFTTGLIAYKTLSATMNLSAYWAVSFWFRSSLISITDSALYLNLCSDLSGATVVNRIPLNFSGVGPTFSAGGTGLATQWIPLYLDNKAPLGNSIASISLSATTDFGAAILLIDHIIACQSDGVSGLNLTSLIGKPALNKRAFNTAYNVDDLVSPTFSANCVMYYKCLVSGTSHSANEPMWTSAMFSGDTIVDGAVTWQCQGFDEFMMYPINTIKGNEIRLGGYISHDDAPGYVGIAETKPLWKRETWKTTIQTTAVLCPQTFPDNGTAAGGYIKCTGGWNTVTNEMDGLTVFDGQNGNGNPCLFTSRSFVKMYNFGFVRYGSHIQITSAIFLEFGRIFYAGGSLIGLNPTAASVSNLYYHNIIMYYCGTSGILIASGKVRIEHVNCLASPLVSTAQSLLMATAGCDSTIINFVSTNSISYSFANYGAGNKFIRCRSVSPLLGDFLDSEHKTNLLRCSLGSGTEFTWTAVSNNFFDTVVWSEDHDDTPGLIYGFCNGALFTLQTSIKPTGTNKAWQIGVTSSTIRDSNAPAKLPVGKVLLTANVANTISLQLYRDDAALTVKLVLPNGQIAPYISVGLTSSVTLTGEWETVSIVLTPTETRVVEIEVWACCAVANAYVGGPILVTTA